MTKNIPSDWAGSCRQFLGQLFAGWFSDRFGRTKTIYLMTLFVYLGVMTEILSQNRNDYTGAKIIMGVATGMMQVAVPTYVAEVTPREIRGITVGCFAFYRKLPTSRIGLHVSVGPPLILPISHSWLAHRIPCDVLLQQCLGCQRLR